MRAASYKLNGRPSLDLIGSYTYKGQNGGLSPLASPESSRAAAIGLQLTVPLYTSGAIDSRQRESVAKKSQAEQDLDVAQRDMRLQVQDAFLSVKTGVSRVGALDQSVLSAQTALEAATLGRDLGTRTELDVLDAQQRVFAAPSTWRRRATTTCSAASDSLRRPASCRRAICIR